MTGTQASNEVRPNRALGIVLAAAASIGLGTAVAMSRMAYEGGANALSIASVRSIGVVLLIGALLLIRGRRLQLASWQIPHVLGLGLLLAFMYYGNIAAVQYIPVGMAALLFFIYPPLVALILVVGFGARFSVAKAAAAIGAFSGLGLALGVSFTDLRWEGICLSLGAGCATAINAVWIGQKLRAVDALVLTFHMGWISAIVLWTALLATGGVVAPVTASGWFGATAVILLQMCCLPMYFASIQHAGAQTATMVTNIQPLASIAAAYALYAEVLSPLQGLGAILVIGSIALMQLDDGRASRVSA